MQRWHAALMAAAIGTGAWLAPAAAGAQEDPGGGTELTPREERVLQEMSAMMEQLLTALGAPAREAGATSCPGGAPASATS